MKKYFLIIFCFIIFLSFCFDFSSRKILAVSGAPETIEESQTIVEKILNAFPNFFKEAWNQVKDIFKRFLEWLKNFYNNSIGSHINNLWDKIKDVFNREVETRKPDIENEFEKEKQELKEEVPKTTQNLWQRFLELIR